MKKYTELSGRYIKSNKKRTAITILTIMVSMAIMVSFSMIYSAEGKQDKEEAKNEAGYYDVIFNKLTKEQYNKLKDNDKVKNVYMAKNEGAVVPNKASDEMKDSYDLVRLTPNAFDNVYKFDLMQGRLPENEDEIVLDHEAVNTMGVNIGLGSEVEFTLYPESERNPYGKYNGVEAPKDGIEKKIIKFKDYDESFASKSIVKYKLVGITENMSGQHKVIGYINEDKLYNSNLIDSYVNLKNNEVKFGWGENGYGDEKSIADDLGIKNFSGKSLMEPSGNIGSQVRYVNYSFVKKDNNGIATNSSDIMILLVIVFMFAAIFNIFNISMYERIRHIGIMRSMGGSRKQISKIILKEASFYAIIGIVLGVFVGYIFTKSIFIPLSDILNINISSEYFSVDIGEILEKSITVYLMVLFSANAGMAKEIKMTPIEAMNTFSGNTSSKIDDIGKNKFIEGNKKIEYKLAYKNLYRNITRNNICTIVMALSMILFIFYMNSFLNGNTLAITSKPSSTWDLSINQPYNPNELKPTSNKLKEELKSVDGVEEIYSDVKFNIGIPIKSNIIGDLLKDVYESNKEFAKDREYKGYYGANVAVRVVDEETLKLYEKYLLDGNLDYDTLSNNGALIINNGVKIYTSSMSEAGPSTQTSGTDRLLNVDVNDEIKIPTTTYPLNAEDYEKMLSGKAIDDSAFIPFKIEGILKKDALSENTTEINKGATTDDFQVIITKKCYEKNFGPILFENMLVKINGDYAASKEELKNIADENMYTIKDYNEVQEKIKEKARENLVIQVMFLIALIIIVIINLITTFYASIVMRKKEFAACRAIGMSEKQMRKIVMIEIIIMGLEAIIWAVAIAGFTTLRKEITFSKLGVAHYDIWAMVMIGSIGIISLLILVIVLKSIKNLKGLSIVDDLRSE